MAAGTCVVPYVIIESIQLNMKRSIFFLFMVAVFQAQAQRAFNLEGQFVKDFGYHVNVYEFFASQEGEFAAVKKGVVYRAPATARGIYDAKLEFTKMIRSASGELDSVINTTYLPEWCEPAKYDDLLLAADTGAGWVNELYYYTRPDGSNFIVGYVVRDKIKGVVYIPHGK